jgi:PAS domain S-box-containing protein
MSDGERQTGQVSRTVESPVPLDVIPLHSTNLLTVLDPQGVIQYESPSIERIYGFDQEELVGDQVAGYFHPADRERVLEAFQRVVASEDDTVEAVEYRHETATGEYCWVESVASGDPTPQGYYVVNTRDISSRKERERALERKTERLDRFARLVAHDLRAPLTVAAGHLELAREDGERDEGEHGHAAGAGAEQGDDHLAAVSRALDRMDGLTEDLLTLARDGGEGLSVDAVDLRGVAEKCWATVETDEDALAVRVERPIVADEGHLTQLVSNLLQNAVNHGGEDVRVTVGELTDRSGFFVADDGPGVPAEEAESVFEEGRTSAPDGTGYGLAIVRAVAEAHGWSVTVTESRDGGARFEVAGVAFPSS